MLFKYTEWPKLLKYAEWPYRFILGILFGSRLMAAGPARPLGPEGAPPGPGPGPALPRAPLVCSMSVVVHIVVLMELW